MKAYYRILEIHETDAYVEVREECEKNFTAGDIIIVDTDNLDNRPIRNYRNKDEWEEGWTSCEFDVLEPYRDVDGELISWGFFYAVRLALCYICP